MFWCAIHSEMYRLTFDICYNMQILCALVFHQISKSIGYEVFFKWNNFFFRFTLFFSFEKYEWEKTISCVYKSGKKRDKKGIKTAIGQSECLYCIIKYFTFCSKCVFVYVGKWIFECIYGWMQFCCTCVHFLLFSVVLFYIFLFICVLEFSRFPGVIQSNNSLYWQNPLSITLTRSGNLFFFARLFSKPIYMDATQNAFNDMHSHFHIT